MNNLNRVTLIGFSLKDLCLKATHAGVPVANGVIITTHSWFDDSIMRYRRHVERTPLAFFADLAIKARELISIGTKFYVEGHLSTKRTRLENGRYLYCTQVVVEKFQVFSNHESIEIAESKNNSLERIE